VATQDKVVGDLLGLEDAAAAEARTREALEQARKAQEKARRAYDSAKAAFLVHPSDETQAAVDRAFAERHKAELWVEARASQHETASRARDVAAHFAASAERDRKVAERKALRPDARAGIEAISRLYTKLGAAVATLEDLADRDAALAEALEQEPIGIELLRVACGVRLARNCEPPEAPRSPDLRALMHALSAVEAPGSSRDTACRMRTLIGTFSTSFGSEIGDFVRLIPRPRRDDFSDFAETARAAEELLAELEEEQANGD
jgi:hypothetical protein